jgi:hypothetical protein
MYLPNDMAYMKGGPKCPNHGCPLDGMGFPMKSKGLGICPVSGSTFAYEAEVDEMKNIVDKNGNVTKGQIWKIDGKD